MRSSHDVVGGEAELLEQGKKAGNIDARDISKRIPDVPENVELLDTLYTELSEAGVEITTPEEPVASDLSDEWLIDDDLINQYPGLARVRDLDQFQREMASAQYDIDITYPGATAERTMTEVLFCRSDGHNASCEELAAHRIHRSRFETVAALIRRSGGRA